MDSESQAPAPNLDRMHSQLRRRRLSHDQLENGRSEGRESVQNSGTEFIGRIGGNQAFVVSKDDADYDDIVKKTPDASPFFSWAESFDLHPFTDLELWRQAVIEAWGTCMITFLVGVTAYSLGPTVP